MATEERIAGPQVKQSRRTIGGPSFGPGISSSASRIAVNDGVCRAQTMRRPGGVLSRFELLEHARGSEYENRSHMVDAYVRFFGRRLTDLLR
jgi:hypothetical protein